IIFPVKAPAAATAAAPIAAYRACPVAAPPIIAPVAAPQPAPCPTGVSQEIKVQEAKAPSEKTKIVLLIVFPTLNLERLRMLRARHSQPRLMWAIASGIYKYFLCLFVDDQPAVVNLRAVISCMRRIWTGDNAGWIVSIPRTGRVTSAPGRILFFSVCLGDGRSWNRLLFLPLTRYTAYARVRALRVCSCAKHTQCNCDRR